LVNEILYLALIALASANDGNNVDARQSAGKALTKLEGWVSTSEWNHLHKMKFLQAEIAVHDGNYEDAAALYDEAIRIAGEHRFIHEQALASERCGMFYSSKMSNAQTAATYFTQAAEAYMKWGAKRKAAELLQMLTT
jgi:tetratricopeptide (TPR) repeat protein